jgi:ATP-dependent Clp protease ATP-binding subunit ClpA
MCVKDYTDYSEEAKVADRRTKERKLVALMVRDLGTAEFGEPEMVDIEVEFTDEAVGLLAEEGFDPEFGARPLRRTIQRRVDNELSRMVLEGSLNPGDRVVVGAEEDRLTFEVLEGAAAVAGEAE